MFGAGGTVQIINRGSGGRLLGHDKERIIVDYMIPSLLVGVVFLLILAINGLWPFGVETIDHYDMAQQAEAYYYHNYDELFGFKSIVFDWYSNLGRTISGLSEPSVFDLFLYLFPRRYLMECMSLLMMIKIMAAALTMNIFLRSIDTDFPFFFRMMLSAGYGLCGFVLMNYTIPQWIDMTVIVPLALMFAERTLRTGHPLGLSISIFLIMIEDYYFGIQMIVMIFLIGGAYLICRNFEGKNNDADRLFIFRFVLGIGCGLGLSSLSWLPEITGNLNSARLDNASDTGIIGTYMSLLENVQPAYLSRWFSLLMLALPAAFLIISVYQTVRKKRFADTVFVAACGVILFSQLFVESVHLILHFGSYVNYPVRNSFMIYCVMAAMAVHYSNASEQYRISSNRLWKKQMVTGLGFVAAAVAAFRLCYVKAPNISDHTVLIFMMLLMLICCMMHVIFMTAGNGSLTGWCMYVWLAEMIIIGSVMIGKPLYDSPYGNDPEQEGEYIRIVDQLVSGFGDKLLTGDDAATCRIKNPDCSLNANYGIIMRRETLSGWNSLASEDQIDGAVSLGYSSQFTRLLDSGGNIFSDTILHVTDVVSHQEMDEALYEKVAETDAVIDHITGDTARYYLYKSRYEVPFAIPVEDIGGLTGPFRDEVEFFNSYSRAMGYPDDIVSVVKADRKSSTAGNIRTEEYEINARGNVTLYFSGSCPDTDYYNTVISVNGKTIGIPSIKENDNIYFPAHFNNRTVELGSFSEADVNIRIDMDISDPDTQYDYFIYAVDRDKMAALCRSMPTGISVEQGKRSLTITTKGLDDKYKGLLIPVSYDRGWSAEVNGSDADVTNINGLFMFVPIQNEDNEITMTYFPYMMKQGIWIAVFSAILLALICHFDRQRKPATGFADTLLGRIYVTAFTAAFLIIYVFPAIYALLRS